MMMGNKSTRMKKEEKKIGKHKPQISILDSFGGKKMNGAFVLLREAQSAWQEENNLAMKVRINKLFLLYRSNCFQIKGWEMIRISKSLNRT